MPTWRHDKCEVFQAMSLVFLPNWRLDNGWNVEQPLQCAKNKFKDANHANWSRKARKYAKICSTCHNPLTDPERHSRNCFPRLFFFASTLFLYFSREYFMQDDKSKKKVDKMEILAQCMTTDWMFHQFYIRRNSFLALVNGSCWRSLVGKERHRSLIELPTDESIFLIPKQAGERNSTARLQ